MKNKTEETKSADAKAMADRPAASKAATAPQIVPVLTRFERAELDAMKDETGATADATAVACFVRKNLRKRGRQ